VSRKASKNHLETKHLQTRKTIIPSATRRRKDFLPPFAKAMKETAIRQYPRLEKLKKMHYFHGFLSKQTRIPFEASTASFPWSGGKEAVLGRT